MKINRRTNKEFFTKSKTLKKMYTNITGGDKFMTNEMTKINSVSEIEALRVCYLCIFKNGVYKSKNST